MRCFRNLRAGAGADAARPPDAAALYGSAMRRPPVPPAWPLLLVAWACTTAAAPAPPSSVHLANDGLAVDTTIAFAPSPDAVRHEVLVRRTHVFAWEEVFEADTSGRAVVPRRIDDHVFAVRAVDDEGERSLAVVAGLAEADG